jgi:hypothetical protein
MAKKRMINGEKIFGLDLVGPLQDIVTALIACQHQYPHYQNLRIAWDLTEGGDGLYLFGDRPETDKEYAKRMRLQEKAKDREKEVRQRQIERLKNEAKSLGLTIID